MKKSPNYSESWRAAPAQGVQSPREVFDPLGDAHNMHDAAKEEVERELRKRKAVGSLISVYISRLMPIEDREEPIRSKSPPASA